MKGYFLNHLSNHLPAKMVRNEASLLSGLWNMSKDRVKTWIPEAQPGIWPIFWTNWYFSHITNQEMEYRKRGIGIVMPIIVIYLHLLKFTLQPELFCIKRVKPEVLFTPTPNIDMTKSQTRMRLRNFFFSIIQVKEHLGEQLNMKHCITWI